MNPEAWSTASSWLFPITFSSSVWSSLWTPEHEMALRNTYTTLYEQVWLPLQVPSWSLWKSSLSTAWRETREAITSVSYLTFLSLRPVVLLLIMFVRWISKMFWKWIIVQGISQQGVQYVTIVLTRLYHFQRSLSPQQVLIEVTLVLGAMALYKIHRFLQRRAYFQRFTTWIQRQRSAMQLTYQTSRRSIQTFYERSLRQIAKTSVLAAMATIHLTVLVGATLCKVFFPRFVKWIACDTALLTVMKLVYPCCASLQLIHDKITLQNQGLVRQVVGGDKRIQRNTPKNQHRNKSKLSISTPPASANKRGLFPYTSPRSATGGAGDGGGGGGRRRQSHGTTKATTPRKPLRQLDVTDREIYWSNFWMVSAGWHASLHLISVMPVIGRILHRFEWCKQGFIQLELLFYLWIYLIPVVLPELPDAPESRPALALAPIIGSTATSIFQSMIVFSDEWWQKWVVRWTRIFFDVVVLMRLMSRETADSCRRVIAEGKSYLVPLTTLLMPRFISIYGVLFVQYCVPLHKQQSGESVDVMLRYWILHGLVTNGIHRFAGVLWWIPLSTAATFLLFLWMVIHPPFSEKCIHGVIYELEIFRILPPSDPRTERSMEKSWTRQGVNALLQRLPRAADVQDENDDDDDNNEKKYDDDMTNLNTELGTADQVASFIEQHSSFQHSPLESTNLASQSVSSATPDHESDDAVSSSLDGESSVSEVDDAVLNAQFQDISNKDGKIGKKSAKKGSQSKKRTKAVQASSGVRRSTRVRKTTPK